jgi:chromosome segregation ATPase
MTTENYGYIIDVIADLQKRLASETASNRYLRGELEMTGEHVSKLNDILNQRAINIENLNAKIADLEAEKIETGHLLEFLNNQIAEQKETIETLRESVKIGNENYNTLEANYSKLVEKYNSLYDKYMTLKGFDNGK